MQIPLVLDLWADSRLWRNVTITNPSFAFTPRNRTILFRYWKQYWAKSVSNPYLNPCFSFYIPQPNDRTMTWPQWNVLPQLTCRVTTTCLWTTDFLPFHRNIPHCAAETKTKYWCNLQIILYKVNQSHYRPLVPRGFQEVKVPRLRGNGTGWC